MTPVYSLIFPVFNEEENLSELYDRVRALLEKLDGPAEVILVDDGSRDRSYPLLVGMHAKDPRFKIARFSRNFGHQTAITAGMDLSQGQAVVIMDSDLQDPPEVVLEMAKKWREGFEIVYAVREDREGESFLKKATAALFYRFLRRMTQIDMPLDVGDFRLVDRSALEAFRALRENNRYVRGMFSWVGFKQTGVGYRRSKRFAGSTKYPFRKMLALAINGLLSFSNVPLRMALNLGFLVSTLAFLIGIWATYQKLSGGYVVPGWASLTVAVVFLAGIQLLVMGVIGEYIGRIHDEVKNRPLYIIHGLHGFEGAASAHAQPRAVVLPERRI